MKELSYDELNETYRKLLDAANEVKEMAYNPYSKFYVGAALLTVDGQVITGANVENSAYGSTICAERMALGRANAMGYRDFRAIAVIGVGRTGAGSPPAVGHVTGPCGSCRQMLFEFASLHGKTIDVIMSDADRKKVVIATIHELLPLAFGPDGLGVDAREYQNPGVE